MQVKTIVLAAALSGAPGFLHAQFDFKVADRDVQVHSFASQGFLYSNNNNFLTMPTSNGSFAFTDGGVNVSTHITDRFRVGAQAYVRNVGQLGKGHVKLDWAFGDYKFKDWFGVRAGKVKTTLGLFNDTQDMDFLHTWALLPQSLYPLDLRASTIAHNGGDIYGTIKLQRAGSLHYTAYVGSQPRDTTDGAYYSGADSGTPIVKQSGWMGGLDARWDTPVPGLTAGVSWASLNQTTDDLYVLYHLPAKAVLDGYVADYYADYTRGKWRMNGEYRMHYNPYTFSYPGASYPGSRDEKSWFTSVAYRVGKRLELGTYHSRYYLGNPLSPDPPSDHIFDQAVTARLDLTKFWTLKAEEHFMDGHGDPYSARGFYLRDNGTGLKPHTNLLVVRVGIYF